LVGKDEKVANILINHPSCSRQHAVIQYRKVNLNNEEDSTNQIIKPYIMDLESTNGTFLNKQKIDSARYYELKPYDILNFGLSTRDYVLMRGEKN
jgi:smad nuclear-interacting protein 1